jgi:enoyl-CoA hydratase
MDGYPTYEAIEVEFDAPVATLRFNRPDRLNAMGSQLQKDVIDVLDRFEADDDVRAVILCGAGRAFSAGYDLQGDGDTSSLGVIGWKRLLEESWPYARRVWNFRKPIIAAVHGYALAGACEIAMLCDMTIASDDCRLGEPEIRFSTSSTLIMPWIVPMKIAKELLFTGKMISAQRAYEIGMVNEVVPAEKLMDRAMYHARLISKVAPLAVQLTKEGINRTYEIQGLSNALAYHDNLTAILDGSETDENKQFNEIRLASGLRAALDWRDQQFKEVEEHA